MKLKSSIKKNILMMILKNNRVLHYFLMQEVKLFSPIFLALVLSGFGLSCAYSKDAENARSPEPRTKAEALNLIRAQPPQYPLSAIAGPCVLRNGNFWNSDKPKIWIKLKANPDFVPMGTLITIVDPRIEKSDGQNLYDPKNSFSSDFFRTKKLVPDKKGEINEIISLHLIPQTREKDIVRLRGKLKFIAPWGVKSEAFIQVGKSKNIARLKIELIEIKDKTVKLKYSGGPLFLILGVKAYDAENKEIKRKSWSSANWKKNAPQQGIGTYTFKTSGIARVVVSVAGGYAEYITDFDSSDYTKTTIKNKKKPKTLNPSSEEEAIEILDRSQAPKRPLSTVAGPFLLDANTFFENADPTMWIKLKSDSSTLPQGSIASLNNLSITNTEGQKLLITDSRKNQKKILKTKIGKNTQPISINLAAGTKQSDLALIKGNLSLRIPWGIKKKELRAEQSIEVDKLYIKVTKMGEKSVKFTITGADDRLLKLQAFDAENTELKQYSATSMSLLGIKKCEREFRGGKINRIVFHIASGFAEQSIPFEIDSR